jgi:MoaA/NifB/PqqE/SkfB family radical SAM enzyme
MVSDLVPLCRSIYERCRPSIINIPTNSLLYRTIPEKVAAICQAAPEAQVIINLSLDGVGDRHDAIRGVPGNFERFEANYRALRGLKCPNLTIGIHSVISRFNVQDAVELFDYALGLEPSSYITEIAEQRVELGTVGTPITPTAEDYGPAIDELIARLERRTFSGISRITEAFRVEYYRLVKRILAEKRQVIPCYAGWASAQIHANGDVWPCCVEANTILNLRDVGYDFRRVWFSGAAEQARKRIRNGECHCPLANASYTNMLMHPPTLVRVGARLAMSPLSRALANGVERERDRGVDLHAPASGGDRVGLRAGDVESVVPRAGEQTSL